MGSPTITFATAFFIPGGSTGFLDQIRAGSCTSTSTSCTTRATTRPPSPAPASTRSRTPSSCPPASSPCLLESTLSSSSPSWLTAGSPLGLDMGASSSQVHKSLLILISEQYFPSPLFLSSEKILSKYLGLLIT